MNRTNEVPKPVVDDCGFCNMDGGKHDAECPFLPTPETYAWVSRWNYPCGLYD